MPMKFDEKSPYAALERARRQEKCRRCKHFDREDISCRGQVATLSRRLTAAQRQAGCLRFQPDPWGGSIA